MSTLSKPIKSNRERKKSISGQKHMVRARTSLSNITKAYALELTKDAKTESKNE